MCNHICVKIDYKRKNTLCDKIWFQDNTISNIKLNIESFLFIGVIRVKKKIKNLKESHIKT